MPTWRWGGCYHSLGQSSTTGHRNWGKWNTQPPCVPVQEWTVVRPWAKFSPPVFANKVLSDHSQFPFVSILSMLQWQGWVVMTKTAWPAERKIFDIWPFTENCLPPLQWDNSEAYSTRFPQCPQQDGDPVTHSGKQHINSHFFGFCSFFSLFPYALTFVS